MDETSDLLEELRKSEQERFRRELTPQEELRKQHIQFHEKHKGHEQMHAEMFIILIFTLLIAQIVLVEWKKRHYRFPFSNILRNTSFSTRFIQESKITILSLVLKVLHAHDAVGDVDSSNVL